MKIEKITYQKAFQIGPFLQEKIGVEITLDDTDSPDNAFLLAKQLAEDFHKQANPHLDGASITDAPGPPRDIQIETEPAEYRVEVLIKDIERETVLRNPDGTGGLLAWKMVAATNPKLQAAFDLRKAQLELDANLKDMEGNWPHEKAQKQ